VNRSTHSLSKVAGVVIFALLITTISQSVSGDNHVRPAQAQEGSGLLTFVRTVEVTPDDHFLGGGFARINYVPATDHFVVTFGGPLAQPSGGCGDRGYSYKVYTTDLQETGETGTFACDPADSGSVMVDNGYYFAVMTRRAEQIGWHLLQIDAANWTTLVDTFFPLDYPQEGDADPMVAYVNGQVDISSAYTVAGVPPGPDTPAGSYGTHHHFFTTHLQFIEERILTDTPHINGSSMIYVDGVYYLVTANLYDGNVIVMRYDTDWNYLGMQELIPEAHWSTGLAFDGERFYLAYTDTSQRTEPGFFPVHLNIHLAAFDRDWNLIDDVAVTDYAPEDRMQPGRPWVILHGNRLYVSYDLDTIDPVTHEEQRQWQALVSVYELNTAFSPSPTPQPATSSTPAQSGQTITCSEDDRSELGVLRSTDHGATWTFLGNACIQNFRNLGIQTADSTCLRVDNRVVLYFIDFNHLFQPVDQILYRITSEDGMHFDQPQPAYTQTATMVDPTVLRLADGSFRLYVPSEQEGIISAVSSDGLVFTREDGARIDWGGMPGALLLPDNRVRIFLSGGNEGKDGIFSDSSEDGLNFTTESGVRIEALPDIITNNPEPIRLADGTYLMLYMTLERQYDGTPPREHTEIHLATSTDGYNWTTNPTIIGYGGTSCIVEAADGTLYIFGGETR
jgi:hypothetical protein